MILVGQYDSPFVRRVAIALHMLDLPFERDTRSVFADAAEMRKINPLGRIPSLILDTGEVLIDSWVILDHIDEIVGPARALLPERGADRRRGLRIAALSAGGVDKAGAAVYERVLRPPERLHAPWIERVSAQARSALVALEAETGAGWYLGQGPSTPDIMAACMVFYMRMRAPELFDEAHFPRLASLAARAEALPAFMSTRPSPDETMPTTAGK